jgi:peptide/nickel transport system permease protein
VSESITTPATPVKAESATAGRRAFKRLTRNRRAIAGAAVLLIMSSLAIFAPFITPYDPIAQNIRNRNQPPTAEHILGTDQFGRDLFTRIIYGGRVSLAVGLVAVGIGLGIGGLMGLLSAFYGGVLENVMMRISDVLLAMPGLLLALAIVAALGPGMTNVMIAVGIAYIPIFARITRSAAITVRELDYVTAARAAGARDLRIMFRHVLPNSLGPIIVQTTLSLAGAILAAAGLSFLGLGAQPPTPEWGSMINAARPFIRVAHWTVTYPGVAILVTVLALNLVGDGLRDALDPRHSADG